MNESGTPLLSVAQTRDGVWSVNERGPGRVAIAYMRARAAAIDVELVSNLVATRRAEPGIVQRFVDGMRALRIGDPMSPDTEIGPLALETVQEEMIRIGWCRLTPCASWSAKAQSANSTI